MRLRRAQERELRGGRRLGELRAARACAVSAGAAQLRAASDVSYWRSGTLESGRIVVVLAFLRM